MDLSPTPAEDGFRAEARKWLAANKPALPMPSGDTAEGFEVHREWERRLFEAGWAVVSWPAKYGGRDASLWEWLIFEEEYYAAGLPQRVAQNGIFLLAPTVFEFGTDEQKDRILPRMAGVEDMWCQGWSEPGAGSDLAGITSRATRDDDRGGWRLTGQKTWTTRGAFCTHLFGLFRTDPEAERHHGMTYFLVDLGEPGITVRPVDKLDGDAGFAEVFFDGAFVPDTNVLGGLNDGWSVAMATTGSERGLSLRSPGRFMAVVDRLIAEYRERPNPEVRGAVADGWMAAQAYKLATEMTVTRLVEGVKLGAESSLSKVFWSEMDITLHETALRLLGDDAITENAWMKGYQFALAGPIYAGTNEIQRNIIAERLLGLPRKMRSAFSDEQLLLRDTVRALLQRECPPSVVRAAWSDRDAAAYVWKLLEDVGVFDPSMTDLDLGLVFEETGRAALPGPFVERVVGADVVEAGAPLVDRSVWWRGQGDNDRAALGTAAQLVGLAARMIDMTVDHVKERKQFGVAVGSYQAVKHHLANALLKVEYARPVVYRAAYAPTQRDVSFAKVYANEAAGLAARVALQCHGAIGYSFEYDLHLWMKRAWVLQRAWGDTAFHHTRVADAILEPLQS